MYSKLFYVKVEDSATCPTDAMNIGNRRLRKVVVNYHLHSYKTKRMNFSLSSLNY